MSKSPNHILLARAAQLAADYLDRLAERPVGVTLSQADLVARLEAALPDEGQDALGILERQVAAIDPAIIASAGPRYFGHVIGGAHPAALVLDWMTAVWDQNAVLYATSPANAVVE